MTTIIVTLNLTFKGIVNLANVFYCCVLTVQSSMIFNNEHINLSMSCFINSQPTHRNILFTLFTYTKCNKGRSDHQPKQLPLENHHQSIFFNLLYNGTHNLLNFVS